MQTTEQRTHDRKRWDRVDLDQKTHKEDRSFEVGELRNQTSVDQESHAKKKKKNQSLQVDFKQIPLLQSANKYKNLHITRNQKYCTPMSTETNQSRKLRFTN